MTKKAISYVATKAHNDKFGARDIGRIIDNEIKEKLSDEILFGKLKYGGNVKVTLRGEKLELKV